MPEGFASIDDLKVAITASTADLEKGLDRAKALIDRFAGDGEQKLGRFDSTLGRLGSRIETVKGFIAGWAGVLDVALGTMGRFIEKAEGIAIRSGLKDEVTELRAAFDGLGTSVTVGFLAAAGLTQQASNLTSANLKKVEGDAKAAKKALGEMSDSDVAEALAAGAGSLRGIVRTPEYEVFADGELARIIESQSKVIVDTMTAMANSVPAASAALVWYANANRDAAKSTWDTAEALPPASSALDAFAASAKKGAEAGMNLANPFYVKQATGWWAELIQTMNIGSALLEKFAALDSKSKEALKGELSIAVSEFEALRTRFQQAQSAAASSRLRIGGLSVEDIEMWQAKLKEAGDRVQKIQAEMAARPTVSEADFEKVMERINRENDSLDLKARAYGLAAGEASELLVTEKALAELGVTMEQLGTRQQATLKAIAAANAEKVNTLEELRNVDAVEKSVAAVEKEAKALAFRATLIGRTADEVARLNAEYKVRQLAEEKEVELTDEMNARMEAAAAAAGKAAAALKGAEGAEGIRKAIADIGEQAVALDRQAAAYGMTAGAAAALAAVERVLAQARRDGHELTDRQIDALVDQSIALEEAADRKDAADKRRAFDRDLRSGEKEIDAIRRKIDAMGLEAGAAAELTLREKLLAAARREGAGVTEADRQRIDDMARAYGDATREARRLEMAMDLVRDAGRVTANALTSAFDQWMRGTEVKGRELVANLLREFAKLTLMRTVLDPAMRGAEGWLAGLLAAGAGAAGAGAAGGGWVTEVVPAMASGGIMQAGVPTLVGERGPEMVIPRGGERVIPNHALGGMGGGSVSVNLSIDARGATRDSLPELERQMATLQRNLPRIVLELVSNARDRAEIA